MQDTATEILDAAERLFAADGYGATSIRSITREADVNVASVHYHFGSKEAVLRGVLDRIATPINDRRNELLDALGDPSVGDLVEAFIRPDLEILQTLQRRNRSAARFAGRIYADPSEPMATVTREQFEPTSTRFATLLAQALPHLTMDEVWWRIRQTVAVIVNIFASYPQDGLSSREMEETIHRLVVFLTAALQAPDPKGTPSTSQ